MKFGKIVGPALFLALVVSPLVSYAQQVTEIYLNAVDLGGQGKFSEAKKAFQEILAVESPHERAERCLQIIADLERQKIGNQAASRLFKGLSYFYKDQFREAVAEANLALKMHPKYERAYNARGAFYFGLGRNDRAMADYNQALKIDPQYAGAYYNRGCLYLRTEEYELAIADFDRALQIEPKFASAFYNRGVAHFLKGEFLWALTDFNRAQESNPRLAEAHFNRAEVLAELGKEKEAVEAYKKFLQYASPALSRQISYARKRLEVLEK